MVPIPFWETLYGPDRSKKFEVLIGAAHYYSNTNSMASKVVRIQLRNSIQYGKENQGADTLSWIE